MAAAPPTPYRFSPEEMRVLQECNRESFYQRCLPIGTLLGVGTYMAVKSGRLQPNARFGAVPKVVCAAIVGYFVGKVSYQPICAQKMMKIPGSKIGALLRSRKYGSPSEVLSMDDHELEKAVSSIPETERYSDISNKSHMDMDLDRPFISGLEDYRPSGMDDIRLEDNKVLPPSTSPMTTYDELRKQNREDYEQKRTKAYRGVVVPEEVPSGLQVEDRSPLDKIPRPTNVYGDLWEK